MPNSVLMYKKYFKVMPVASLRVPIKFSVIAFSLLFVSASTVNAKCGIYYLQGYAQQMAKEQGINLTGEQALAQCQRNSKCRSQLQKLSCNSN
ncbi:hypothetical protein OAE83_01565 [bacterium]|nr:hypothetical protein [bacterium]